MKKPSTSQPSAPLNATRSTGDSCSCFQSAAFRCVSCFSLRPLQIGDVEIVEMRRIVDGVGEPIRLLVDVDEVHGAIA